MVPETGTFDLNELSAAADVTPRTIRYYVQQGLLPSPGTRGPGTRYDRAHLERLHLIRRLQREHLPLAEIRRRLEGLDDDAVRKALHATTRGPVNSSALEYVRDLLTRQVPPGVAEEPMMMASASPSAPTAPKQLPAAGAVLGGVFGHLGSGEASRATRSTWERIPLARDVELHVRRPLSREQNRYVERLMEAARDIYAEEP